ncbi:hypothetical protein CTI12_AA094430 [Artemisia annua]|uniref:DUF632 domain-containing protein n=1 Tax=Artemisia annua TaxID=35608 RepID=A0A2U1PLK5_ARTAN|nr:hypothetical protein CTI12_AA094430 [Artemisia annua]
MQCETCEPLRLCKERKKFMKQAIDSRYSLAAAHVVYMQSLQNIGIALRKFAETEVSLDLLNIPQVGCNADTGGQGGELGSSQPHSPNNSALSYMKSGSTNAVTVNIHPSMVSDSNKVYVDDIESLPPPPPPLSWDYFNPSDGSFRLMGHERFRVNLNDTDKDIELGDLKGFVTPPESVNRDQNGHDFDNVVDSEVNESRLICKNDRIEQCNSKDGCLAVEETEDPSEFITGRAKDFLSCIKDIEDHFIRASKSGNEVSRMLEANKIQVSYTEAKGSSTGSSLSLLTCFRGDTALVLHEPPQTAKVITWKRSLSTHPSLSPKPDTQSNDDNGNNFIEDLCMIAGSHSSTLDRLYAWERKLYDEVKASECIRKEYDRKCDELRHQFTKDLKPDLIDKTRAVTKDLHSRMTVALHTVNSISRRIEEIRDEELQPQLVELIQGLLGMWKSMLECHHTQYITISLASHSNISRTKSQHGETKNQILAEVQHEIEYFGSSFSDLVKCYTLYVESINTWLQNCIILPKERAKGRRAFCPWRAVAPPIFVICRNWSAGIQNLPSQKLSDTIKDLLSNVRLLYDAELENGQETKNDDVGLNLSIIHSSLTKVLDRLTKFSEDSLKMYEDIKQNSETAGNAYSNYRPPPRPFSI